MKKRMDGLPKGIEKDTQIFQANPIIETCKKMSLLEGRLFYLGLMELRPKLPNAKHYHERFPRSVIPTQKLIELFGGNKWYYHKLVEVQRSLAEKNLDIFYDGKNHKNVPMFAELDFQPDTGLAIEFSIKMKPFLLELDEIPYTQLSAGDIFILNSTYAIRLLELILQYRNMKSNPGKNIIRREISVANLRKWLAVPAESYQKMGVFKQRVLDAPIREINSKLKYNVTYEDVKTGRSITSFIFTMIINDSEENTIESVETLIEEKKRVKCIDLDPEATVDNLDANIISVLRHYGVGKIISGKLANQYSDESIRNNIRYSLKQKGVKNLGAYIAKAVREDYYSAQKASEIFVKEDTKKKSVEELYIIDSPWGASVVEDQNSDNNNFLAEYKKRTGHELPMSINKVKSNNDKDELKKEILRAILDKKMPATSYVKAIKAGIDVNNMCKELNIDLADILNIE